MTYKDGSFVINILNEWHTYCDGISLMTVFNIISISKSYQILGFSCWIL